MADYIKKDDGSRGKEFNAIEKMNQGYKQIAEERGEEQREYESQVEKLQKQYDKDPESLNGIQLITLGLSNLEEAKSKKSEKAEAMYHNETSEHDDSSISSGGNVK